MCPSDSSHLKHLPASGRIPREDVCDHFRFTLDAEVKTHANVGSIMHPFPPQKEMLKSYPSTSNVTAFENGVVTDVIS